MEGEEVSSEDEYRESDPSGRWERLDETVPSSAQDEADEVSLAYDSEKGHQVVWNVIHLKDGKVKGKKEESDGEKKRREEERQSRAKKLKQLTRKFDQLKQLKHANIIRFYDHWVGSADRKLNVKGARDRPSADGAHPAKKDVQAETQKQKIVWITELMTAGTLRKHLRAAKKNAMPLPAKIWKRWSRQILSALKYMHERDLHHGNIRTSTIHIQSSGMIKIGSVSNEDLHKNVKTMKQVSYWEYLSPESWAADETRELGQDGGDDDDAEASVGSVGGAAAAATTAGDDGAVIAVAATVAAVADNSADSGGAAAAAAAAPITKGNRERKDSERSGDDTGGGAVVGGAGGGGGEMQDESETRLEKNKKTKKKKPELVLEKAKAADVYAFGIVALEMASTPDGCEKPYSEYKDKVGDIKDAVINRTMPDCLKEVKDERIRKFIAQCLQTRQKRPAADKLLLQDILHFVPYLRVFAAHRVCKENQKLEHGATGNAGAPARDIGSAGLAADGDGGAIGEEAQEDMMATEFKPDDRTTYHLFDEADYMNFKVYKPMDRAAADAAAAAVSPSPSLHNDLADGADGVAGGADGAGAAVASDMTCRSATEGKESRANSMTPRRSLSAPANVPEGPIVFTTTATAAELVATTPIPPSTSPSVPSTDGTAPAAPPLPPVSERYDARSDDASASADGVNRSSDATNSSTGRIMHPANGIAGVPEHTLVATLPPPIAEAAGAADIGDIGAATNSSSHPIGQEPLESSSTPTPPAIAQAEGDGEGTDPSPLSSELNLPSYPNMVEFRRNPNIEVVEYMQFAAQRRGSTSCTADSEESPAAAVGPVWTPHFTSEQVLEKKARLQGLMNDVVLGLLPMVNVNPKVKVFDPRYAALQHLINLITGNYFIEHDTGDVQLVREALDLANVSNDITDILKQMRENEQLHALNKATMAIEPGVVADVIAVVFTATFFHDWEQKPREIRERYMRNVAEFHTKVANKILNAKGAKAGEMGNNAPNSHPQTDGQGSDTVAQGLPKEEAPGRVEGKPESRRIKSGANSIIFYVDAEIKTTHGPDGEIATHTLTTPGTTGYVTGHAGSFTGGTGTGATFRITTAAAGVITAIEITDSGTNYTAADVLTIPGGDGTARLTVNRIDGESDIEHVTTTCVFTFEEEPVKDHNGGGGGGGAAAAANGGGAAASSAAGAGGGGTAVGTGAGTAGAGTGDTKTETCKRRLTFDIPLSAMDSSKIVDQMVACGLLNEEDKRRMSEVVENEIQTFLKEEEKKKETAKEEADAADAKAAETEAHTAAAERAEPTAGPKEVASP